MKTILVISILAVLITLACGAAPLVSLPTPANAPTATVAPLPSQVATSTPSYELYHLVGCWNIRETPGGTIIGSLCNTDVVIFHQTSGDWMKINQGWMCLRAFGIKASCEYPNE